MIVNEIDDVMLFCNLIGNLCLNIMWIFQRGLEVSIIKIGEIFFLFDVSRD